MSNKRLNLSTFTPDFISDNSPIPHDITFKFLEDDPGEVSAHKNILGMVSKVFLNMFFKHNTRDKSAREMVMKNTNRTAFKIMIEAIYNSKSIEENLRGKSLHEMFTVLNLVTQYEIPDLVLAVKACLSSFPITEVDSVLDIASDAVEYLATFEEDARNVLLRCAKFLNEALRDVNSFSQFVSNNSDRFVVVDRLLILMAEMKPPCSNCLKNPCLNGDPVKQSQVREGLKVANNPAGIHMTFWKSASDGTNVIYFRGEIEEVVNVNSMRVQGKWLLQGGQEVSRGVSCDVIRKGKSGFVFRCN